MADNAEDPTTWEDLENEIAFVDVLIDSLDDGADSYHAQLAALSAKKDHYRRLMSLIGTSDPSDQYTDDRQSATGAVGDSSGDQWSQPDMNGRPGSNHSSSDFSADPPSGVASGSNAYAMPAYNPKRSLPVSSYLDSYQQHPSKRHTPDPSAAGTPNSSDGSYERAERTVPSYDGARIRQQAAELAARRQYEAQQEDYALARQLSNAQNRSSFASSSSLHPNVQTTLNYNGSYQGLPPAAPSEAPYSRHTHHSQPYGSSTMAHRPQIKPEPRFAPQQQHPQRAVHPPEVVDLTGFDSDEDGLEEIAPTNFTPNHRPSASTHRLYNPAPTTMQQPTTMQMPGAWPGTTYPSSAHQYPSSVATGGPNPNFGMSLLNGVASSLAGSLQQLNNMVHGSSSAQPWDLDDDDMYRGPRQLPSYGNYAGNEDLYQNRYDAIAAYDSTKTKEEIQALLTNIRPDEEMPAHLRVSTPEELSVKLHKYQELGLTWLQKCEDGTNQGGILADDMGLGKTIQMLSLMVTRKSTDPRCKTTLIIAPLALMRQWAQEIKSKVKPGRHQLSVFTHHGSKKAKSFNDLRMYDVVLTTYGSISSELKKVERFKLRLAADPDARPLSTEKCIFLDKDSNWYRLVLDEAQCIKNKGTQAAKGACMLKAKYRFCVTGTPMMNNVEELFSLIHFLRIKPYCRWDNFRSDVSTPLRSANEATKTRGMQKLQALCKAVMLRRTKSSYFEGEPILVLPPRSTQVDNPIFSEDEKSFYQAVEGRTQLEFNKYLRRGTVGTSYSAILVLLLRLRQACCHPHLLKDFSVAAAADLGADEMIAFAESLAAPVVARIKESGGNFECPVCYDVTPNPAIFVPCGHDTCSDCFSRIADPANAIQNGEEGAGVRCPNCRGTVDPKRLTDFHSFKKVHMPELLSEEERRGPDVENSESDSEDDESSDGDSSEDEDETLNGFVVKDDEVDSDEEVDSIKDEEAEAGASSAGLLDVKPKMSKDKGKRKKGKGKGKGKGKAKEKTKKSKSKVTLAELKKLSTRSKKAKRAYLARLRKDWQSSAKLDKTMEILHEVMGAEPDVEHGHEKVLIFSQWTSLLDLLEVPIHEAGFGYRRYDGSMSAAMRGDAVDEFKEKPEVRIMLISLKAGNAGLNLNMASQVIILDPFWNPYIEEQAIDRAHRFGQMRPVKIHRLLIQETVEDRIIALQEKKRALISKALDEKEANALSRLGVQELAYLFGVTHDPSQRVNYTPRVRR